MVQVIYTLLLLVNPVLPNVKILRDHLNRWMRKRVSGKQKELLQGPYLAKQKMEDSNLFLSHPSPSQACPHKTSCFTSLSHTFLVYLKVIIIRPFVTGLLLARSIEIMYITFFTCKLLELAHSHWFE